MSDIEPDKAKIEALKLFNEFQAQGRARSEAALKLVVIVSGSMLTLSVGAVLGASHPRIPDSLISSLVGAWGSLFYSIAASMLLLASMIGATFHMGVRWRKILQGEAKGISFVATWPWLRITNVALAATILVSFLLGLFLMAQVAIGVARASSNRLPVTVTAGHPNQPVGTAAPPNMSKLNVSPPSDPTNSALDAKDRAEKAALDRKLVDFNGDLAFYTEVLAVIAVLQFFALCAQAVFLRLAFKEAKRAGDIARDAMVAGERAFVFAMGIRGFWEHDVATNRYYWRFRPILRNSGDTPTRNMTMHSDCIVTSSPLPMGFNFDYPAAVTGTGLIPPQTDTMGGLAPASPKPAVSPQDIVDAQQGKKFIYLLGWARYFDVFPDTPQHISRFCWAVSPVGDPFAFDPSNPSGLRWDWIVHTEGNCADDECTKKGR